MSSLKRRLPDSPDDSDHECSADQPFAPRNPRPKRRRFDLARNLSRLSLFEQTQGLAPIVQEQVVFQESSLPSRVADQDTDVSPWSPYPQGLSGYTTMDMDREVAIPVIKHSVVEEPTEPPLTIPEVRMRHTSSYEPEKDRIVVTDLDSSEDESESPLKTSGSDSPYSVSHAFLSRVNPTKISTSHLHSFSSKLEPDASQALVLFTPSPWSAKDARQLERMYRDRDEEKNGDDPQEPQIEELDVDAMEIE